MLYNNEDSLYRCMVEVPTPKEGQHLGPGGVRDLQERMVHQYRPIPYSPSDEYCSSAVHSETPLLHMYARELGAEIISDVARSAWEELGYPLVRHLLRKARSNIHHYLFDEPKAVKAITQNNSTACSHTVITGISTRYSEAQDRSVV